MARRTFTNIVLAFGLFCSIAASTAAKAQQVTFAISPTQVAPAVGDTLKLNIVVQNFTNIVSFQYAVEWDLALLSFVGMDSVNIPDQSNFLTNAFPQPQSAANTLIVAWNSSGTAKSTPNGQRIFRLRLKVMAASSNYWAKFSDANTSIEVIQDPGLRSVTPVFVNLGTPPGNSTIPVGGKATGGSTLTGQKFCVPVTTTDFTNIVSAQWVNKWNAAVLRFDSISTLNNTLGLTTANFGASQTSTGRLAFSWNSPRGSVSVNNNDTLYKVCYTAIGANGTNSIVSFDSAEVYRRGGGSDTRVALNPVNGTVTVGNVVIPPSTGLTFAASNHVVNTGESVCVKVRVAGFTDIVVMQWSMHWDSTKMTLTSATSTAGLGIAPWVSTGNQGDFNNIINGMPSGTLRFLWVSPNGSGFTLADSTIMMELCFTYNGAGGTNSTFRFDGTPMKIQVTNGDLVNITPTFRSGNVSVATSTSVTATGVVQNTNCPNGTDGKITLTPAGGNGTFTYSWTGPNGFTAITKDIAAGAAGKYYVTVTSASATKVDSFTIGQPAALVTSTQLTQVSCKNGTTGAIVLTVSGGTAPYTYSWLNPNGTTTATKDLANLAAGIYKLTVTDAKLCTTNRTDTLTEPTLLTVSTQVTQINCNGGNNGAIVTTPSGGTAPYTYSWLYPNGTTATAKDLATLTAGIYKLTVTDAKLCTANRNDTLTAPVALTISTQVTPLNCNAGNNGAIVTTPSGGTAPYTYSWLYPNGTTATSKDLATLTAGIYKLTVTDAKLCTANRNDTLTAPVALTISTQVTPLNCNAGNNGAIVTTPSGGTAPYTYSWLYPNGTTATSKDLATLTAGIYKLTVTDAKLCTANRNDTLIAPVALTISTVATNVTCKSGRDGAITTTVSGGTTPYTYSWTSTNGTTSVAKDLTALAAGTYNLTVTDAKNCASMHTQTVTEPDSVRMGAVTIRGTRCSQATGAITVGSAFGGSGTGYSYSWTGPNNATFGTQNIANVAPGQYVLTVKDSKNCSVVRTFEVVDTAANITNSTPSVTNVTCNGTATGAISLTATGSGPLTYAWTGPGGFTANTLSISNLRAGNYNLFITDAGCAKTVSATVLEAAAIATATQSVNVKCKGNLSGSIALNATGGTGVLSITWTGPNGFTATGQNIGSLKAGAYTARITDGNACERLESITITEPTDSLKITNTVVTEVKCNGEANGTITVTVAGGTPQYIYAWTGSGGFTSAQKDLINLRAGEYRLTVTDANGCRVERTFTLIDPSPIVVTASTTDAAAAPNGTITLSVTGGQPTYTFLWTGQGVAPTAQNQTGLCPGTYNVMVTDVARCSIPKLVTVGGSCSTPMRIVGTPTIVNAGCSGQNLGKITINFEGGVAPFKVEWFQLIGNPSVADSIFNETVQARSSMLINRQAGRYAVKITDAVGQTLATPPMIITQSVTPINVTAAIANETCRGNDGSIILTITDGAAPYTALWTDAATGTSRFNLVARLYGVTVKDANGCLKEMNDLVVRRTPCPLTVTSTKVNPTCFGSTNGSITINVTNGEPTYTVTLPSGTRIDIPNVNARAGSYTITGLGSGTYTVKVKDTINVEQSFTHTLVSPTQIVVNKTISGDNGTCTGSIVLNVTGGSGNYTYLWNTGATSRDLFNLCCNDGRRYSVTVRDANALDCRVSTNNDSITCNIAILTLDSSIIRNPVCKSDSTSSRIDVFVRGGVLPYIHEWRNQSGTVVGNNSPILLNQPPGRYYLTVSDSRTPNPQRIVFDGLLRVTSTLAITNVELESAPDNLGFGSAKITFTQGTGPYVVTWPDGSTTTTATTMAENKAIRVGNWTISLTDIQGCIVKVNITITSRACATIRTNTVYYTPKDTVNIRCAKNCDGGATILSLSPDFILPIRSYQWTSGEVGPTAFKLCGGINSVSITDANGKVCISRVDLKAPAVLKDTVWVDDKARTLEAVPSGGVQPYKYRWTTDNFDTTRKVTVTRSGNYVVLITDFLGCEVISEASTIFDATCLEGAVILTPNDDGLNENFRIKRCDYKSVSLDVYNRWGQLVYQNKDYRDQWYGNKADGQSGDPLPDGVYMYILSATDATGKQQLGKGTINIVRN